MGAKFYHFWFCVHCPNNVFPAKPDCGVASAPKNVGIMLCRLGFEPCGPFCGFCKPKAGGGAGESGTAGSGGAALGSGDMKLMQPSGKGRKDRIQSQPKASADDPHRPVHAAQAHGRRW